MQVTGQETATDVTLTWEPPSDADHYLFYTEGAKVSNAAAVDKNGTVKKSVKFSKSGAPYEVVCIRNNPHRIEVGVYPENVAISNPSKVTVA
jgi:hypothetical protein